MKTIFVAGSVRKNIPIEYIKEGEELAKYIQKSDYRVCCCADEGGIIGKIYSGLKENRARLFFSVPKVYIEDAQKMNEEVDVITDTINQRTDTLIKEADICIVLPGGIGTLYELLSLIETKRAGEHNKEIIIVNSNGFFNQLFEMLKKIFQQKFAEEENQKVYKIVNSVKECIEYLENEERGN